MSWDWAQQIHFNHMEFSCLGFFWLWGSAMCCVQAARAQGRRMNWCKIFSVTKESQRKSYRRLYSWIIKYRPRECSGWAVLCSLAWKGSSALAGVADSHIVGTPTCPLVLARPTAPAPASHPPTNLLVQLYCATQSYLLWACPLYAVGAMWEISSAGLFPDME